MAWWGVWLADWVAIVLLYTSAIIWAWVYSARDMREVLVRS